MPAVARTTRDKSPGPATTAPRPASPDARKSRRLNGLLMAQTLPAPSMTGPQPAFTGRKHRWL
jgi:hypothetical protein